MNSMKTHLSEKTNSDQLNSSRLVYNKPRRRRRGDLCILPGQRWGRWVALLFLLLLFGRRGPGRVLTNGLDVDDVVGISEGMAA